ncbi:MAG TPA: Wzz/FepE/Etk N-terminal domain-containing protein [Solirubrobacteraceae bacterium]|nr:Wzz/FepE/Etk N-terminal domain-containing protein [Solirubrobacteraceae bacterium]
MANVNPSGGSATSWLGPDREESDLRRHLTTLRHRGWLIVATVVLALVVAVAYVKTTTPVYQASSSLLVTAVPSGGSIPTNLPGLLYQSADPTRDIQTAATVVDSMTTARAVKTALKLPESPVTILSKISVQPISDSNVLAVTAKADTADGAARLANAFAAQTIAVRTAQFRAAVSQQISSLTAQIAASPKTSTTSAGTSGTSPTQELTELQTLRTAPLPDLSVSALATPPTGRESPRATLSVGAALVVGLVLGILGVLALEAFDLTLRREDQLRSLFRLPILARVPHEGEDRRWGLRQSHEPRTPDSLTFPTREAFRTLRAMALASRSPGDPIPRSLLVTSAAPSEGKTTTALNLAASIGASGSSVILIEGDLRKPSIGGAVGLMAPYDVTSVVTGEATLERALVTTKRYPGVRFLLAEGMRSKGTTGDALFLPSATTMLREANELADFVIVDSPPLLAVIDALQLAREADLVLLVAQLGRTDLRRLEALGSLLAEAHIDPAGIALIGATAPGGTEVYGYQAPPRSAAAGGGFATQVQDGDEDPLTQTPSRRSRRLRPRLPGARRRH